MGLIRNGLATAGVALVSYLALFFIKLLYPAWFLTEPQSPVNLFHPSWTSPYDVTLEVDLVCDNLSFGLCKRRSSLPSLDDVLEAISPENDWRSLKEREIPSELIRAIEANSSCQIRFRLSNEKSVDPRIVEASVPVVERWSTMKGGDGTSKVKKRFLLADWEFFKSFYPPTIESTDIHTGGYWLKDVTLYLVDDATVWPDLTGGSPPLLLSHLKLARSATTKIIQYLPLISKIQQGVYRSTSYVPINTTFAERLPLRVRARSTSLSKWLVLTHMEVGLNMYEKSGVLDHSDLEDVRRLISETSPQVLTLTLIVSTVHLLLDGLALHSEIGFWSKLDSSKGLSLLTLWFSLIGQFIVTAYLYDGEASALVLIPAVLTCFVDVWKALKALRLRSSSSDASTHASNVEASKAERKAFKYMSLFLLPMIVFYACWILIHHQHKSWASWLLTSAALCVYAGGFVFMTPQIFLNYELKSVDHMDWKALSIRAFNTFIDDFFALLIPMPNLHRVAVLRDDLVFVVFLYQRFIYRERSSVEAIKEKKSE